jgi:serine/threonine-protein kinase
MGTVYLGHETSTREAVAIKILNGDACRRQPAIIRRCFRGASSIQRVRHKNIARVRDYGTTSDGIDYVVMEYVEGTDLDTLLSRHGPLPWQQVVRIGLQLGDALGAAHALNVVHRDVKPTNCILIQRDTTELVKLVDFGISRECQVAHEDHITAANTMIGTAEYLAPECAHASRPTPQMDIYSLGVTLFKLLTGTLPFQADTPEETLTRKMSARPPPPSKPLTRSHPHIARSFPPLLDTIIMKAISRHPRDRFHSTIEMNHALVMLLRSCDVYNVFNERDSATASRPSPRDSASHRESVDRGSAPAPQRRVHEPRPRYDLPDKPNPPRDDQAPPGQQRAQHVMSSSLNIILYCVSALFGCALLVLSVCVISSAAEELEAPPSPPRPLSPR